MVAASLHGTLGQVVIAVVVTLLVYWSAERYAEILAAGVRGRVLDRRRIGEALRQRLADAAVVLRAGDRAGRGVGAGCRAADRRSAGLGLSTVLLAGIGYEAARRSGASVAGALPWAAGTALLGVAVIVLKLMLH